MSNVDIYSTPDFFQQDFGPADYNPTDFAPSDFTSRDFENVYAPPYTGPPYPPPPQDVIQPTIGTLEIADPHLGDIGEVIPFAYWDTIISQYGNSAIITALVGNFQQYIDQTFNMEQLYDNIWNINTASGYGLDVWGRIVGVQRTVQIQTGLFFGFAEQNAISVTVSDFSPGGTGPFYNGVFATTNFQLADQAFRQLIIAKALNNISNGSIPSINAILRALFPNRGNCFVQDNNNMSLVYVFQFPLHLVELAIIESSGVIPKPVGVASTISYTGLF